MNSKRSIPWLVVLCSIIALSAFLRLKGLTFQSYWDDELFSVAVSDPSRSLFEVIRLTVKDVHPPLFQILLWLWFKCFGFTELTGRLFPAICGILAIPVIYLLGNEAQGREVGLIAALICSVNFYHLYYSQEVRSYSLFFLLGSLSFLFCLKLMFAYEKRNLAFYIAFTVALVYTHFFGIFAVVAQFIWLLAMLKRSPHLLKTGLIAGGLILLMTSPLIPVVFKNASMDSFWIQRPPPDFIFQYFRQYFGSPMIAAFVAIFLFYGLIRRRSNEKEYAAGIFLVWVLTVYLMPYIRSMISTPMLTDRNTIVALPAIFILCAFGLAKVKNRLLKIALTLTFLFVSLTHLFHEPMYYRVVTKPQIREAALALIGRNPERDSVFSVPWVTRNFNVYFSLFNAPFRTRKIEDLIEAVKRGTAPKRFWIIDGQVGRLFATPMMDDKRFRVFNKTEFHGAAFVSMESVE